MLNYNKLYYFTIVAKMKNITKAAELLYISQPALSIHMKEFEQELGIRLFNRQKNKIDLTPAGQILYQRTAKFYSQIPEILNDVKYTALIGQSHLVIGCLGTDFIKKLPDIVSSFHEKFPKIEIDIQRMNWNQLSTALEADYVDIAFQLSDEKKNAVPPGFQSFTVDHGHLIAVVHKSDPLAKLDKINISQLKDRKFIFPDPMQERLPHDFSQSLCRAAGFEANIVAYYPYIETLLMTANLGNVVTIQSDLAPLSGFDNLRCLELEENIPLNIEMIWRKNIDRPAIELFTQYIMDEAIPCIISQTR
ncbi:MAG: LysR family transcriptional regulator [Clostridiales bacterium]|nr:LysR family transcriptional regulator [Clostridiales bacterium]